jgi:signal peptidase I
MREERSITSRVSGSVRSLTSTIAFAWLFTHQVAQATVVPTESMKPTILVGDHFFLDKVAFPANYPESLQKFLPVRTIRRGDIIAFWSPADPNTRLVKRVIGLPGETIEIRDDAVFINGLKLDEPYAVHTTARRHDDVGPVIIPADQFFMMGDNRDNSKDSRFWGFAHRKDFIGKPVFVYWSYDGAEYPTMDSWTTGDWVAHFASVATHFWSNTRWSRTGVLLR